MCFSPVFGVMSTLYASAYPFHRFTEEKKCITKAEGKQNLGNQFSAFSAKEKIFNIFSSDLERARQQDKSFMSSQCLSFSL